MELSTWGKGGQAESPWGLGFRPPSCPGLARGTGKPRMVASQLPRAIRGSVQEPLEEATGLIRGKAPPSSPRCCCHCWLLWLLALLSPHSRCGFVWKDIWKTPGLGGVVSDEVGVALVPLPITDALQEDLDEAEDPLQPHQRQRGPHFGPLCSIHFLLRLQDMLQGPELGRVRVGHSFDFRDVPTYVCLDGRKHWGPKAIEEAWQVGHRLQEGPCLHLLFRGQLLQQVLGQQRHFRVFRVGAGAFQTKPELQLWDRGSRCSCKGKIQAASQAPRLAAALGDGGQGALSVLQLQVLAPRTAGPQAATGAGARDCRVGSFSIYQAVASRRCWHLDRRVGGFSVSQATASRSY
ncbi:hypothetical protein QTO34_002147 [Cnephaeus nilssonii]|uniref:Uncharacterized protein n=1 Tax=Cnephaeus nilssonii TaxID=3371016 RepID=A0AA40LKZ7_CNENI|nr:hypothetical protein QTO34_002147 [Eptesicus nilssonii]